MTPRCIRRRNQGRLQLLETNKRNPHRLLLGEFLRKVDKISWLEGILKNEALHCYQARARELQKLRVQDNWPSK
jgi:hypothetical protein